MFVFFLGGGGCLKFKEKLSYTHQVFKTNQVVLTEVIAVQDIP